MASSLNPVRRVFPAHAGMSLEPDDFATVAMRFPRSRGDEPQADTR